MSGTLVLIWAGAGVLVGLLAYAGKLWLVDAHRAARAAATLALALLCALLGGWLGLLLIGPLASPAMALWVSALGVAVVPWLLARRAARHNR